MTGGAERPPVLLGVAIAVIAQSARAQQSTAATYEDWTLRCSMSASTPPQKSCEIEQLSHLQNKEQPFSRVAIPRLPPNGNRSCLPFKCRSMSGCYRHSHRDRRQRCRLIGPLHPLRPGRLFRFDRAQRCRGANIPCWYRAGGHRVRERCATTGHRSALVQGLQTGLRRARQGINEPASD